MADKKALRQKTWAVFIKPYTMYKNVAFPVEGVVKATPPCNGNDTTALGGVAWMLYKQTTSFPVMREIIREIMDDLGYNKADFMVVEVIPTDYMVTPLA